MNIILHLIRRDGFSKKVYVPTFNPTYVMAVYNPPKFGLTDTLNVPLTYDKIYFQWTSKMKQNKKSQVYEMKEV